MSWKAWMTLVALALVCWLSLAALSQATSNAAGPADPQASPTASNSAYLPHIERAASLPLGR